MTPLFLLRSSDRPRRQLAVLALAVLAAGAALAQQDKNAERAQRRAQLQVQQMQQQLQEAQAAKSKAEAEREALLKRGQKADSALARASSAERRLSTELQTVQGERTALTARVAQLEQELTAQKAAAADAAARRDREAAQAAQTLREREADQAALQGRFAEQVRMVTECTDKNQRLAQLSLELIERYRSKTFADVARQKEPLLGLGEVQTFNLLQEYRDRSDAERFKPTVSR